jgi:UDP-N-acetylglucosamine--N-acetylmuramyl-(pentapeptide) pyrophosphoryl-undecaprenol N-acetylglucosamine transferase
VSTVKTDFPDDTALRCLIAGGGSGGHLFPAIAVVRQLQRTHSDARFLFHVSTRPVDRQVLTSAGFPNEHVAVTESVRLPSTDVPLSRLTSLPSLWKSYLLARAAVREFRPHIVVGCGALASVPAVLAAHRGRIPVILLEQNSVPGTANRMLASRASLTLAGLPLNSQVASRWPTPLKVIGTPIRQEISALCEQVGLDKSNSPKLLILGGSQGSQSVNRLILEALADEHCVPSEWQIVHQTGAAQVEAVVAEYARRGRTAMVVSFLNDLPQQLASATVVVSRGGAGTIQELACAGVPAILIPFSKAAADHQMINARCLAEQAAAVVVNEVDDDAGLQLRRHLNDLIRRVPLREKLSEGIRAFARPHAAADAAAAILQIAGLS